MSIQLIQKYYAEIDKIKRYSGASNESSLRKPFQDLLEQYARAKGLVLVAEVQLELKRGTRIRRKTISTIGIKNELCRLS